MNSKIKEIMARSFEVPIESINEQSTMNSVDNWDSIHHTQMILSLERTFDITIPDEEVGQLQSFKLIEAMIHRCYETRI
jgi:acyl carrier protein